MINPSSITYEQTKVRSCHGGAILSEEYLASIQTPSMGVEFELDGIPNVEPPSVEFLTVSFSKLEITPQYLDISTTLEIGIELSIDNYGSESTKISYQPENGKTVDLSDRIQPIKLDLNVESSDDILTGDVKISAMHPDVSDSYRRTFTISKGSVLLEDGFDDQSLNTDLWKIVSNGGSVSENSDGELHLVCQNTDVNTVVRSKNSYSGNLDLKCKVKNDPKADTGWVSDWSISPKSQHRRIRDDSV